MPSGDALADAASHLEKMMAAPVAQRLDFAREEMRHIGSWSFDVFQLTGATCGWPLLHTAYALFEYYGLFDRLGLQRAHVVAFLIHIEYGSNAGGNSYHNAIRSVREI
jgi:hypothetical protein